MLKKFLTSVEDLDSPKFFLLISIGVIILVYLPFLIKGGFIIDDWGVVYTANQSHSLISNFLGWFPLFSNRPFAPILLVITSNLFGLNPQPYILINLLLVLGFLSITGITMEKFMGRLFSFLFVVIGAVPIIATTVIFSPVMQITATASLFLWAVSLWCLYKYTKLQDKKYYLFTYALILIALLVYEVILPLLALTFFLPFIISKKDIGPVNQKLRYLLRYGVPMAVILGVIYVYQKLIMPHFMIVYSRFHPFNPFTHLSTVHRIEAAWIDSVINVPIQMVKDLFASGLSKLSPVALLLEIVFLVGVTTLIILKNKKVATGHSISSFTVILITFLSGSVLFLLSNSIANTFGYYNRGLSTSWFGLALLLAFFGSLPRKYFLTVLTLVLTLLSWSVFSLERDSYIRSYQTQLVTINEVIQLARQNNAQKGAFILGDLPATLPGSFHGEDFFYNPWDFGESLNIYSNGQIAGGDTLTAQKVSLGMVSSNKDAVTLDGYWQVSYKDLWFYSFDFKTSQPAMTRISNWDDFKKIEQTLDGS